MRLNNSILKYDIRNKIEAPLKLLLKHEKNICVRKNRGILLVNDKI